MANDPSDNQSQSADGADATSNPPPNQRPEPTTTTTTTTSAPPPRLGSITRGRGTPRPRYTGRRSAVARAELEKEAAQKKAEEARIAQAHARDNARKLGRGSRGGRGASERGFGDAGRGRGRGRGGFIDELIASGPFSSGQVAHDVKSGPRRSAPRGAGPGGGPGGASSSHSSSSRVKTEPGTGDVRMGGTDSGRYEDGGFISSDDDNDESNRGMPRVNVDNLQIDAIDLTGDDDGMVPVRLARVPHQQRKFTLALTNDLTKDVSTLDIKADPSGSLDRRKSKPRAKDFEITGSTSAMPRPRAYSSSSSTGDEEPVKAELDDDDDIPLESVAEAPSLDGLPRVDPDAPSSPESKRRAKDRIKAAIDRSDESPYGFKKLDSPKLYTDAEKLEWELAEQDRYMVFEELGHQPSATTEPIPDGTTDEARTTHAAAAAKSEATRDESLYLFQFPPILPTLIPVDELPKPAPPPSASTADPAPPSATVTTGPTNPATTTSPSAPPTGHIGKLRIHQSGRAYLDYGGFRMELGMGMVKSFPEQVLVVDLPGAGAAGNNSAAAAGAAGATAGTGAGKVKVEGGGSGGDGTGAATAYSMGLVRGEFVVTPDLDELLK